MLAFKILALALQTLIVIPVSHIDSDSAQWHITRLSWSGSYSDYTFALQTEFWSRRPNGRLITLVFMFIPYISHQRLILRELRRSVRC